MKIPAYLLSIMIFGLSVQPSFADEAANEIKTLLEAQAEAWNAGDIEAFMAGYWKSDELRFASGGTVTYGWAGTLANYENRYPTPEKMGQLTFSGLDVRVLSDTFVLAFGRWDLKRKALDIGGLFTLLFEKMPEGWRIVADHTSSDDLPVAVISE